MSSTTCFNNDRVCLHHTGVVGTNLERRHLAPKHPHLPSYVHLRKLALSAESAYASHCSMQTEVPSDMGDLRMEPEPLTAY